MQKGFVRFLFVSLPTITLSKLSMTCLLTKHNAAFSLRLLLLQLLLGAEVVGVSTFLLAAIHGASMKARVTFATNHLLAIILASEDSQRGLDDTTTKT